MSFDYLRRNAKVIADMGRTIPGSGWWLVEYRGKRYWLHVRSRTILESSRNQ